ncbi:MAG: MerR family transcriptional regulator [Proteobacteria bacterium]|nr:MerR family transcriptional regulator [Pseudomonadota bacterium]
MSKEALYSISELAAEFSISTRTIRYYEEKGLLDPCRSPGNYRLYTRRDRTRLKLILRGKQFGVSLDEVAELIGLAETDMGEVEQIRKTLTYIDRRQPEIARRIGELRRLYEDIEEIRRNCLIRLSTLGDQEAGGKG